MNRTTPTIRGQDRSQIADRKPCEVEETAGPEATAIKYPEATEEKSTKWLMYNIFKRYARAIVDRLYGSHLAGRLATEASRVRLTMIGFDIETTCFGPIPGHVTGTDPLDECHIDLAPLCN